MTPDQVVVGFGCPRAGTTFLGKCLEHLKAPAWKLSENVAMHPCNSTRGLLDLEEWFGAKRLVLIRIARDPLEIVESFLAARQMRTKNPGIARKTDREVVAYIRSESESVAMQAVVLRAPLVTIRYEELRSGVVRGMPEVPGARSFVAALANAGQDSVRVGRMSEGLGRVSTDEERAYFESRLRRVRDREGYR